MHGVGRIHGGEKHHGTIRVARQSSRRSDLTLILLDQPEHDTNRLRGCRGLGPGKTTSGAFKGLFFLSCRFVREMTGTIKRHEDGPETTRSWMKTQVKVYSG